MIAEQCYDELVSGSKRSDDPAVATVETPQVVQLPPSQPREEHKPVDNGNVVPLQRQPTPAPRSPTPPRREGSPAPALPAPDAQVDQVIEQEPITPVWITSVPPSYQKGAQKFIESLEAKGGFKVDEKGYLVLEGRKIDYLVDDFLRVTNLPYNKGELPHEVESWLRTKRVTTFRNPNLVIRPKWTPVYSLRRSTMGQRTAR